MPLSTAKCNDSVRMVDNLEPIAKWSRFSVRKPSGPRPSCKLGLNPTLPRSPYDTTEAPYRRR